MKINCIIIEDEPLAMERTKDYASRLPYLDLLGCFESSLDALVYLKSNKVDLIFLDINMDELSGIELLEALNPDCDIIITTAYHEYALKGYELNVTDYLLKPFTFERFLKAVEKVESRFSKKESAADKKYIFVKTEYRLQKISLSDIIYIEGMRDYRRIHTSESRIMTLQTFKEFEQQISPDVICRVHKSYMVSLEKIDSVERERIKVGDMYIPISETYKKEFFERINRT